MVISRPAGHGPLISVDHVDLRREGKLLLDDASLVVAPGEHWALIGPNGAGKTTLLNLMGAVIHPTAGRVDVLGRRMGAVDVRGIDDAVTPAEPARRMAHDASRGELIDYGPGLDHFAIYTGDEFERTIVDQIAFLRRTLKVAEPAPVAAPAEA